MMKYKRLSHPRIKPLDYVNASKEEKQNLLNRARIFLDNPTLEDISELDPSDLDEDSQFKLRFVTSALFTTGIASPIILEQVLSHENNILSIREKTLLSIRTSWICQSEHMFVSNVCIGMKSGLTWEDIETIIEFKTNSIDQENTESILLRVVDELCNTFCISNPTWNRLTEKYDNIRIFGIIRLVGHHYTLSMFSNALSIQVPERNEGFGILSDKLNLTEWFTELYQCMKTVKELFKEKTHEKVNLRKSSTPRIAPTSYEEWNEMSKNRFNMTINTAFNIASLEDFMNMDISNLGTPSLIQLYRLTSNIDRTANNLQVLMMRTMPLSLQPPNSIPILPTRDIELIIIRTGWLCRAEYEFVAHLRIGILKGLSWEEAENLIEGPKFKGWNPEDAALLQAVDDLHKDSYISDETWKILSKKYNNIQLMSIILIASRYHSVAMQNNAIGIQIMEKNEGFGVLSEKLNQIEWLKQYYEDIKKCKMFYNRKILEEHLKNKSINI